MKEAVLVMGTTEKISNPKGDMLMQYEEKGQKVKIYKGQVQINLAI